MSGRSPLGAEEPGGGNREPDEISRSYSGEIDENGPTPAIGFAEDGPRGIRDHRNLDVWKISVNFVTEIYRVTAKFPPDERYGLTSQLRRASVSIPTNIAEGYGRELSGSYLQFLRIAQGSAKEIQTLIELSHRLGMLGDADRSLLGDANERVLQMLFRLIRAIERTIS